MSQSQRILVAGTGISGIAATELLIEIGGEVILYDSNTSLIPGQIKARLSKPEKVHLVLGELSYNHLAGVQMCIISPGISLEAPFVTVLDQMKIPIWSEIQLAYQCTKGKLIAITGTNGKTTTTALVGEIMKAWKRESPPQVQAADGAESPPQVQAADGGVYVVGNIGIPYTQTALQTRQDSITVAEVSSFQLETIMDFRPDVSAILNITPDHLDRHHTMEYYTEIKKGVAMNQLAEDSCILNYDDPVLREFGEGNDLKAKTVFFSSRESLKNGYYLDGKQIIHSQNGKKEQIINTDQLQVLGQHNHENVMAAIAVSVEMGVPVETIRQVLVRFQAVEHRIEFVLERAGIRYYNDSKGTNPDASMKAIEAMPGPVLLIAGGYNKSADYNEWIETFKNKVKHLVLIGETRDDIADCAKAHGFYEIMYAEDMQEAVQVCASYADMGDYVLLSPACASWGMFKNYEERGRVFKECVRKL